MSGIISYRALGGKSGITGLIPAFSASAPGTQNMSHAGWPPGSIDCTETFDNCGNFSGSGFTAPIRGAYFFGVKCGLDYGTSERTTGNTMIYIKEGSTYHNVFGTRLLTNSDDQVYTNGSMILLLDPGDTIYAGVYTYTSSGNNPLVLDNTRFMGHFISPA